MEKKERKEKIVLRVYRPGEELIHRVMGLLETDAREVIVQDCGSEAAYGYIFGQLGEIHGCTVLREQVR